MRRLYITQALFPMPIGHLHLKISHKNLLGLLLLISRGLGVARLQKMLQNLQAEVTHMVTSESSTSLKELKKNEMKKILKNLISIIVFHKDVSPLRSKK